MKRALLPIATALAVAAGSAQATPPEELVRRTVERRAVEAAVWGMPIVAFDAMRQAFLQDADARYGDVVYWSRPADWKFQVATPNASSWYVYIGINTRAGPQVLDLPPSVGAGLYGSLNDAWQEPQADIGPNGIDKGIGAKYLLLPPDYDGKVPPGYIPVRFKTYNGYSFLRAIPVSTAPADVARAMALVKKIRVYRLTQSINPPTQRYIDMAGKLFDAVARFDVSFYESLARMVQEEPVQARDLVAVGQLRSIGIEKGKAFAPDEAMREVLRKAVLEAREGFIRSNHALAPFRQGAQWAIPGGDFGPRTAFKFHDDQRFALDERAAFFFLGCAPPVKAGASFHFLGARDAGAAPLEGARNYRLRVPPKVPAQQSWAATVYDLEESNFIRESPKVEVNSHQDLQRNGDGSVDVYFGPKAPAGKESNWVYTAPGRRWVSLFRVHGPRQPLFDKSWVLPDIEEVK